MALKEKIYNFFRENQKRSFHVEKFDETIYFSPVTVLEMQKFTTLSGEGKDQKDFHIWTIIEKAEDSEGKKIFSVEDKPFLEKLPWRVVIDISEAIHGLPNVKEIKKNLETISSQETSSPSVTEKDAS
jgi:hypothetical protein